MRRDGSFHTAQDIPYLGGTFPSSLLSAVLSSTALYAQKVSCSSRSSCSDYSTIRVSGLFFSPSRHHPLVFPHFQSQVRLQHYTQRASLLLTSVQDRSLETLRKQWPPPLLLLKYSQTTVHLERTPSPSHHHSKSNIPSSTLTVKLHSNTHFL